MNFCRTVGRMRTKVDVTKVRLCECQGKNRYALIGTFRRLDVSPLAAVAFTFLITRIVVVVPVYVIFYHHYPSPPPPAPAWYLALNQGPLNYHPQNALFFYDSVHYANIATTGYAYAWRTMWFPLYPLLIRLVLFLLPGHVDISAVVAANIAFAAAFYLFYILEKDRLGDHGAALMSCALLGIFPGSIYFSAAYSESTMLFTVLLTVYFVRRNAAGAAGAASALTALARPPGIFLSVAVLLANCRRWKMNGTMKYVGITLLCGLPFLIFLWVKFGDPLIFAQMEHAYYHKVVTPMPSVIWKDIKFVINSHVYFPVLMDLLMLGLGAASVILVKDYSLRLYTILTLAFVYDMATLRSGVYASFGAFRYCIVLPGIYIMAGDYCRSLARRWRHDVLAGLLMLLLIILITGLDVLIGGAIGSKAFIS